MASILQLGHIERPTTLITMSLLPAQNNFADIQEASNKLISSSPDDNVKRLAGIVGTLAFRCDHLEREVERLSRATGPGKS
jgi:hypothetical protein